MHDNNQQPVPVYMPQIIAVPQTGRQSKPFDFEIPVPPRVEKALEFYHLISAKTAPRVAGNELQIIRFPGKKPTDEEANCMATACNMLSKYFAGQLPMDKWEELRYAALEKRLKSAEAQNGRIVTCNGCAPRPYPGCVLCGGSGKVMVTPVQVDQDN